MSTIPTYPPAALPLAFDEEIPAWQSGRQISLRVSDLASALADAVDPSLTGAVLSLLTMRVTALESRIPFFIGSTPPVYAGQFLWCDTSGEGRKLWLNDGTTLEIFMPTYIAPMAWASGDQPQDLRAYPSAELEVDGLAGGDSIAVTRTLGGANYFPLALYDQNGAGPYDTITADGVYQARGGGFLKWAKAGNASSPTITIRAGQ